MPSILARRAEAISINSWPSCQAMRAVGIGMKILVVDDEAAMREVLEIRLQSWGFDVKVASDGSEGREIAESYQPDMVISDVVMPGLSGLELLSCLKAGDPDRSVVLITAQGSIDLAVEAMKHGAHDFITKPLDYSKLKAVLEEVRKNLELRRESRRLNTLLQRHTGLGEFIGMSKKMRDVYDLIQNLASTDTSVIIAGESGTGKELAARTIHQTSGRANGPFIAVNAAAIPENLIESEIFGHEKGAFTGAVASRAGCFELANRGILFLDEIAEMPMALQPKLLRVLEDGRVRRLGGVHEFTFDVRVLAATNQDPAQAVKSGKLREDLYYRLNVFMISLPPLRERVADLALLAQHFIQAFNLKHRTSVEGLRDETLNLMKAYPWRGNVRELRNVLERAVILTKTNWIEPSHLPAYLVNSDASSNSNIVIPVGASAAAAERELILKTLEKTGQNKAEAARQLGLDVKTIRNKLKSYGIA